MIRKGGSIHNVKASHQIKLVINKQVQKDSEKLLKKSPRTSTNP